MISRRRCLAAIGGSLMSLPFAGRAQAPARTRRVAWLGLGPGDATSPYVESLRAGLSDLGWIEGRNLALSLYWAKGRDDMDAAGRQLLAYNPEVIVTQELMTYAMRALRPASPVVFGFSGDPVEGKLVESFARPGGNFTGITYLALNLVGKRIELLKEWVPQIRRVAILARPQHPGDQLERQASEAAVGKLGIDAAYFPLTDFAELDKAFGAIAEDHCDALVVFPDTLMFSISERIARFAIEARLPSVSGWAPFAQNGLLFSYGPNVRELYRSLAQYVDHILRGAKPADLPVGQPTKIEFVINMRTAKALGLTIPQSLQIRTDRIIE
jgi:putative ABC transport system substrate-binding protein